MVSYSFYETDNRVLRYAEALSGRGDIVEVFALRRNTESPKEEIIEGVRVFRIQDRFSKEIESKWGFLWPLLQFLVVASIRMASRARRQRYDLIHVHNIPDFLVFAAWYPKLTGSKVILDIHDIVPEFFESKFSVSDRSLLVRALRLVEKISAAFADHVILSNHLWLDRYTSRSARADKCSVFINNVDERIFYFRQRKYAHTKPIVIFPGGLHRHQGLDIAVRAIAMLQSRLPEIEFHIYGDGNIKSELVSLVQQLNLTGTVRFFDPISIREIADVMAEADLAVVPKRADSFGNEAYSTKIMEFMSLGVPVVVSSTRIDRLYFNDSVVKFFESGSPDALADAIYQVLSDSKYRHDLVLHATEYVALNGWSKCKDKYFSLVDSLCRRDHIVNNSL